jgi:hypothetical protein
MFKVEVRLNSSKLVWILDGKNILSFFLGNKTGIPLPLRVITISDQTSNDYYSYQ